MHRTYLIETANAAFTLMITGTQPRGPYSATYVGTAQKIDLPWIDDIGLENNDLDGAAEGVDFNALVAMCHREITKRGGEITSIEDISVGSGLGFHIEGY
ncbi:hypothetical protein BCF11_0143 [Collimonas sp. PA-H2]|uniref:hypothetical protein n=1 Tax=Collimonas sp. PA-H2 TaxID=1881062 RepID=UPI000BF8BA4C|nr:hypothetical protein [Collimonas sp. PA-H2]PFH07803.1 hypothetical protein BCF11_0143 [Collimonas sp. PA-H2]